MVDQNWHWNVQLFTFSDSGDRVPIEEFRTAAPLNTSGPRLPPILIKPGATGTFDSTFSMETLKFVKEKKKEIFGGITGYTGTNQEFEFYSDPFPVPANLVTPPWTDLGEQNHFTLTPDMDHIVINPHKLERGIWLGGSVVVPVSIKNASGHPCIEVGSPVAYVVRDNGKPQPPFQWAAIKTSKPILKPGESITSSCYINLDDLESQGFKPGDKVVAVVGGRIPNTDQVFQCSSTPFELPPFSMDKPPKGALQIPGL